MFQCMDLQNIYGPCFICDLEERKCGRNASLHKSCVSGVFYGSHNLEGKARRDWV